MGESCLQFLPARLEGGDRGLGGLYRGCGRRNLAICSLYLRLGLRHALLGLGHLRLGGGCGGLGQGQSFSQGGEACSPGGGRDALRWFGGIEQILLRICDLCIRRIGGGL